MYRKLSEVEVVGPPEATETLVNKINTEHVCTVLICVSSCVLINKINAEDVDLGQQDQHRTY